MSGLFGGGSSAPQMQTPVIGGIRIQTAIYGTPIPLVWGQNRITTNLLWYGDFAAITHSSSAGGGKGGSPPSSISYTYSASVIMGLCEGTITGIPHVWQGHNYTTPAALGMSVFVGAYPQATWPYLTSLHPTQAVPYTGIAYIAIANYALDGSGNLPNHSYEIATAHQFGSGIVDANPVDVLTDFLTNPHYGVSASLSSVLGNWTQYSNYCVANGIFLSPAITGRTAAHQVVDDLMAMTNSEIFESEGTLKIVPYGDLTATGNGVTFTPNVTPVADLSDDDFIYDGKDPIEIKRSSPSDAYNQVQVQFTDRSAYYSASTATAQDQANIDLVGLRPMQPLSYAHIMTLATAQTVAQIKLQRSLYIRNQFTFSVGWRWIILDPMDIVTLTDPALGMNKYAVRILEINEDDHGKLQIVAEDFPAGIATAALYTSQETFGYSSNFNAAPGHVQVPAIYEIPAAESTTGLGIGIAVTGTLATWGGCDVWGSYDNSTYRRLGKIKGGALYGTITNAVNNSAGQTVGITLAGNGGTINSATAFEAQNLASLCIIGNEFCSFTTATLTGTNQYTLTLADRGQNNTAPSAHVLGEQIVIVSSPEIFLYTNIDAKLIGTLLYLKFTSFNILGAQNESLANVIDYQYTLTGAQMTIPQPVNATLYGFFAADGTISKIRMQTGFSAAFQVVPDGMEIFASLNDVPNAVQITSGGTSSTLTIGKVDVEASGTLQILTGSVVGNIVTTTASQPLDPNLPFAGKFWAQYGASQWRKATGINATGYTFNPPFDVAPNIGVDVLNWVEVAWFDDRGAGKPGDFGAAYRLGCISNGSAYEIIRWAAVSEVSGNFEITGCARGQEGTTPISADGLDFHYFPAPGPGTIMIDMPKAAFSVNADGTVTGEIDGQFAIPAGYSLSMSCCAYRAVNGGIIRSHIVPLTWGGAFK